MEKFRYKRGIQLNYDQQGHIYFLSKQYRTLPLAKRKKIDTICEKAGGEYAEALREYVTTDADADTICGKYFLSKSTLERIVRKYYVAFSETA